MLFHEIMTVEIDPDTEVKLLDGYRAISAVPNVTTPQAMTKAHQLLFEFLAGRFGDVELGCKYQIVQRNGYWTAVAVGDPQFAPRYNVPRRLRHPNFWVTQS